LFLQGIPSIPLFLFEGIPRNFILDMFLGISPKEFLGIPLFLGTKEFLLEGICG
jgi:hypothetical protein